MHRQIATNHLAPPDLASRGRDTATNDAATLDGLAAELGLPRGASLKAVLAELSRQNALDPDYDRSACDGMTTDERRVDALQQRNDWRRKV